MKYLLKNYFLLLVLTPFLTGCPEKGGDQDNGTEPVIEQNACLPKSASRQGLTINFQYRTNGQLEKITYGQNTITPYYDSNNNITKIERLDDNMLRTHFFNGNKVTRIESVREGFRQNNDGSQTQVQYKTRDEFTYSGNNISPDRATNYQEDYQEGTGGYKEIGYTNYTYDANGNLNKKEVYREYPDITGKSLDSRITYTYDNKLFPTPLGFAIYEFPLTNIKNNVVLTKYESRDLSKHGQQLMQDAQVTSTHTYNDKGFPINYMQDGNTYTVSYECK